MASPSVDEPEASKEAEQGTLAAGRDCNAPLHGDTPSPTAVRVASTAFLRFDVGERDQVIVLDTDHVVREETAILTTHSIAHHKSPDA
jgi:hypothetical protein